jgi:hypothetical protein
MLYFVCFVTGYVFNVEVLQMAKQCSSADDIRGFVFEESACKLVGMEKG